MSESPMELTKRLAAEVYSREGLRGLADGTLPVGDWFADDAYFFNFESAPQTGPYVGEEGWRQWARELLDVLEDARSELQEVVEVDSENIVTVAQLRGRWKETGIELDFPLMTLTRWRHGKLVYGHGYLDRDEAIAAAAQPARPLER